MKYYYSSLSPESFAGSTSGGCSSNRSCSRLLTVNCPGPLLLRSWSDIAKLTDSQPTNQPSGVLPAPAPPTPAVHQRNWSAVGPMLRARTPFHVPFPLASPLGCDFVKQTLSGLNGSRTQQTCMSFILSRTKSFSRTQVRSTQRKNNKWLICIIFLGYDDLII